MEIRSPAANYHHYILFFHWSSGQVIDAKPFESSYWLIIKQPRAWFLVGFHLYIFPLYTKDSVNTKKTKEGKSYFRKLPDTFKVKTKKMLITIITHFLLWLFNLLLPLSYSNTWVRRHLDPLQMCSFRDFSGRPVVKTPHCRGHGFDPWSGN